MALNMRAPNICMTMGREPMAAYLMKDYNDLQDIHFHLLGLALKICSKFTNAGGTAIEDAWCGALNWRNGG
jgi:hypothetical protein